jgi:hypothetical protein
MLSLQRGSAVAMVERTQTPTGPSIDPAESYGRIQKETDQAEE